MPAPSVNNTYNSCGVLSYIYWIPYTTTSIVSDLQSLNVVSFSTNLVATLTSSPAPSQHLHQQPFLSASIQPRHLIGILPTNFISTCLKSNNSLEWLGWIDVKYNTVPASHNNSRKTKIQHSVALVSWKR